MSGEREGDFRRLIQQPDSQSVSGPVIPAATLGLLAEQIDERQPKAGDDLFRNQVVIPGDDLRLVWLIDCIMVSRSYPGQTISVQSVG